MLPRERVLAALHHEEPDHVPTGENAVDYELVEQILGHPTLYNARWRELEALWDGRRDEIAADYATAHVELVRALEWDYVRVPVVPARGAYHRPRMTGPHAWLGEDGYEYHYSPEHGNVVVRQSLPEMTIYDLPDPDEPFAVDPTTLEAVRYVVAELKPTHFIIGRSPIDGLFPWLETVGLEEFLMRMVCDPEFVERATRVYLNRAKAYVRALLDAGCDGIMSTEDFSDNRGPIMGVERFRRFILPAMAEMTEFIHSLGGYYIKHTDGNTWKLLDCFLEAKVDAWHGIQPSIGMDLRLLKERYGDKLCFFGGVNCETLSTGTPEQAAEEVRYAIRHAAPGGGLVITTGNVLQPGTRLENYLAARQATRAYGAYPLQSTRTERPI
ncbi:MAG: uroporphyrinogen decarboxylase family protein [Anaerolineae bacterium]